MKPHIHLIGIGGSGLSAIARLLLESGYPVSGSDRSLSDLGRDLVQAGAQVFEGHRAENIAGAELVVRSSAVTDDNIEVVAARAAGIPVVKRSDFLGQLMQDRTAIAVGGTHGKTTTTALIAWMLTSLGQDPSYIIGGVSKNLGSNAHAGSGAAFVIEADEYDRMFLGLSPDWIVITHLEHDHPDCYPAMTDYRQAFVDFVGRLRSGGGLFTCADFAETAALAHHLPAGTQAWTYGLEKSAAYQALNPARNEHGGLSFSARFQPEGKKSFELAKVNLQVPGMHNVRNALAALALAHRLGLPLPAAAAALGEFTGTGRRFDLLGETGGITIINDYAHHPTEIRATLSAARLRYPDHRIWAVWQPHTYSRTQTLFHEFTQAFVEADQVIVTEIYAAREANQGFSAETVVKAMHHPAVQFAPTLSTATAILQSSLQPGDILLVLSAGDADQISQQVLDHFTALEQIHD